MMKTDTLKLKLAESRSVLKILFISAFVFVSSGLFAQERTISGKISDGASGDGLPGATITIKGTSSGTITDFDGKFQLAVGDNSTIIISFVGYKSQEIIVGSRSTIDITLEEDITQLSEVVVVGYGTQEAKDVTGVISTVRSEDFNRGAIASPESLIAGKVAGVSVTPSSEPGGGNNIVIRGVTSLNGGQSPLIVVDGVPLDASGYTGGRNGLNFINPNDIESMTILKDASAAAIYGTRAAAGVILITTKSGKAGQSKLSYDGFYSSSKFNGDFGFLSPANFRSVVENEVPQILPLLGDANTKWVDEVIQPVSGQSHNISLSGGSDQSSYQISLNHMINNGVVKFSQNKITRISAKITSKLLNDDLTISVQTRNSFTKDNFSYNVTGTALTFDPTKPIYDPENVDYGGYYEWQVGLAPSNPLSTLEQNQNLGETRRSFSAINADYSIPFVKGLSAHVIASADLRDGKNQEFRPTTYLTGNTALGFISVGAGKGYTYTLEEYLSYKTKIESISTSIDVLAGFSFQEVFREYYGFFGDDLSSNNFGFNSGDVIGDLKPAQISPTKNQLQSYYGRLNFSIRDKYLFTANVRADGSTKFGEGNKYGVFPSVAVGWRIMDEEFMSFMKGTVSDLKIRVGWGQLGNQSIPDYLYATFYSPSTNDAQYQFGDNYYNMLRPVAVDPEAKWETTTTTNIGLDFGLFDNRLSGTLDYYNKVTTDMLTQVAPPAFTNVGDVVTTNVAEMYNKGMEIGLNYVVLDRTKFKWDVGFNAAYNKNEITKLDFGDGADSPGLPRGGISGDVGQTIQVWKVGEPVNAFYTYKENPNGVSSSGVKYTDFNNDGQINEDDLVTNGQPAPDVIIGLTSGMTYKNFQLDFTLRGNFGNSVYNNTASANGFYNAINSGNVISNVHESVLTTNYQNRQLHSDYYVENASFIRMDNITLSYNYNNLKFMNARIYGTVQNLFTFSGYSGPNPEISSGIDNNLYPFATTYIVGVSLNF